MKKLPNKFIKNGFIYSCERRNEDTAIYAQAWNGCKNPSVAYEVIIPQIAKNRFIDGSWRASTPYETYPSNSAWQAGWTFTDLDAAISKYNALSRHHQSRRNRFVGKTGSM